MAVLSPNQILIPFKDFKVGHYYVWTGPHARPKGWSPLGQMDWMLDGKLHRCESVWGELPQLAKFEDDHYPWNWDVPGREFLREVHGNVFEDGLIEFAKSAISQGGRCPPFSCSQCPIKNRMQGRNCLKSEVVEEMTKFLAAAQCDELTPFERMSVLSAEFAKQLMPNEMRSARPPNSGPPPKPIGKIRTEFYGNFIEPTGRSSRAKRRALVLRHISLE